MLNLGSMIDVCRSIATETKLDLTTVIRRKLKQNSKTNLEFEHNLWKLWIYLDLLKWGDQTIIIVRFLQKKGDSDKTYCWERNIGRRKEGSENLKKIDDEKNDKRGRECTERKNKDRILKKVVDKHMKMAMSEFLEECKRYQSSYQHQLRIFSMMEKPGHTIITNLRAW